MELQLRRVIERLHSLLSLLQTTIPDVLAAFTEYFYTQIQQTLVWVLAILLRAHNIPHPILYGNLRITQLSEESKQYALQPPIIHRNSPVLLNEGLLDLLPVLPLSNRCCLAFYSACRTLSRTIVKNIVQTLVDYTPDDPSVDQEKLTYCMNLAGLVQGANEVATAILRSFCTVTAQQYSKQFVEEVFNAADVEGVSPVTCAMIRDLVTCIRDCNDVVCDTAIPLQQPVVFTFTQFTRVKPDEDHEMMDYIEKAITSRLRILPVELKPTLRDVIGGVLKVFAKEVGEEVRANVCYDYQLQALVMNLSFLMTMVGDVVKEDADVKEVMEEVVMSCYDRCYEPAVIESEQQKEVIENGIELYKDSVTLEYYYCVCYL